MSGSVSLATNHSIKAAQLKRNPPSGRDGFSRVNERRRKDKDYMTRHFLVAAAAADAADKKSKSRREIPVATIMMTISENESRNFDDKKTE